MTDHISSKIRALVDRGNVTLEEYREIRCNSWEHEALVPVLSDEAFTEALEHALKNCFTARERPFVTYNQAVEGLYAPELLKRFKRARGFEREANTFAEVIDNVRDALGQDQTHYLIIADDVKDLVDAVERSVDDGGEKARGVLQRIREDGMYRSAKVGVHIFAGPDAGFAAPTQYQPKKPSFTYDEVVQILKNVGRDVGKCGACAAIAFTGVALPTDVHTCGL